MDIQPLKGRVAIVTGGSSGIGRGICLELAREGAKVIVADLQEEPKRGKYFETDATMPTVSKIEELGGQALFIKADVAREMDVKNLLASCVEHFGQLDILVNNAGIGDEGGIQETSLANWDRVIDVNLKSIFLAIRFALPHLRQSPVGRIINISSVNAFRGGQGPAYSASKAGVVNLTRDVALEVGAEGITVNAVCPGAIETAMQDGATEEIMEAELKGTPLKRFGTPRDIGRACVFLASDDAAWITGIAMPVDGGLLSGWAR